MVIRRVGPLSCAKIAGLLYAGIGFIIGGFITLLSVLVEGFALAGEHGAGSMSVMFGAAAIVVLPIFYGALGFISTAVAAWLYNVIAGVTGGVEIEVS
jgi:hypothetical protein